MKTYAHLIFMALLATLLFAGCRTATQHSAEHHLVQNDSSLTKLSAHASGTISSQVQSHTETEAGRWRITYHYDTTKPLDAQTGLPPTQRMEIEGSSLSQIHNQTSNLHAEQVDSVQATSTVTSSRDESDNSNQQRTTEYGRRIERVVAIALVITLLFLIIKISSHVRQNSSKQDS